MEIRKSNDSTQKPAVQRDEKTPAPNSAQPAEKSSADKAAAPSPKPESPSRAAARRAAATRDTDLSTAKGQPSTFSKAPVARASAPVNISGVTAASAAAAAQPAKRTVTFVYDAGDLPVSNLKLKGSWDGSGNPSSQWTDGIPMKPMGDGRWAATVELQDDGSGKQVQWGVTADGPAGKDQWAVFGEENRKFTLNDKTSQVSYAPTTYSRMGAHKVGDSGVSFQFWAPDAKSVNVKITDQDGKIQRMPMTRNEDGTWSAQSESGWKKLEGKAYTYEVVDSKGNTLERTDPYARIMQGEQKGLGRFFVDPASGKEANQFTQGRVELMRFEIDDDFPAKSAGLVFKDDSGHQLTKAELMQRLGTMDPALVSSARDGKFNDLWSQNISADGEIKMTNVDGAFSAVVNNPEKLVGLHYEFKEYQTDKSGKAVLVGDKNKDGKLSTAEQKATDFNDKWSNVITADSGKSFRGGIIADTSYSFKYDNVPREKDHSKWVIYQAHIGSFAASGENTNRSTFEDAMNKLDYLKSMGINTVELLPTTETENGRDWGYMGANSLATEASYGFEKDGKWITGDQAMKMFIDEAHKRGMNVMNDVVYNHVGGEYNSMYNLDGEQNPYFNWSSDPSKQELRNTPWGVIPAYNKDQVKQFFVDHAVSQITDSHFDGLRFDFTDPIKGQGGEAGWDMLREINRQVHFVNPNAFTLSEQFPYEPIMQEPAQANGKGGAGFDATWYTEAEHRLVNSGEAFNPGIVQAAANGWKTDMDKYMNMLTNPMGVNNWGKAVFMISNHDETGNAQRIIDVADGNSTSKIPNDFARSLDRFAAGMGFTGPGIPMFFQGDESMASNPFKWGVPSTWDSGWDWQKTGAKWDWKNLTFNDTQQAKYDRLFTVPPDKLAADADYKGLSAADKQVFKDLAAMPADQRQDTMLNIHRRQTEQFYQSAIALRESSPAFTATAEINKIYAHNDNSVMAFERKGGNDDFIVVSSLNKNNLEHYGMELPPGQWQEVFNSDGKAFGGNNFGNYGGTLNGGNTQVNIPSGGYVVLKKVG